MLTEYSVLVLFQATDNYKCWGFLWLTSKCIFNKGPYFSLNNLRSLPHTFPTYFQGVKFSWFDLSYLHIIILRLFLIGYMQRSTFGTWYVWLGDRRPGEPSEFVVKIPEHVPVIGEMTTLKKMRVHDYFYDEASGKTAQIRQPLQIRKVWNIEDWTDWV